MMCVEVLVIHGCEETFCDTVGELAAALGVHASAVSADPPDYCLCNAYFERLGARRATEKDGISMGGCIIEIDEEANP